MRVALCIEYDGSSFHGWQTQRGGGTVQDAMEHALSAIAGEPLSLVCAGRTDAGVHASAQIAHFDCQVARPLTAWVRGVNAYLPKTVAVRWAAEVSTDFHARFSACGRYYRYVLLNRPQRPAICTGRVGWFHAPLNLDALHEAAACLTGAHDFSAFRAAECQAKSPVKHLRQARVTALGDYVVFDFEADAFLHHMVRNMVGSLVYVGAGRQSPGWISELLAMRNRQAAAPTFAPDGLYLSGVRYAPGWGLPEQPAPVLSETIPFQWSPL